MRGNTKDTRTARGRRCDRLIRERERDPCRTLGEVPDPPPCPVCGANERAGRRRWGSPPADDHRTSCPACRRLRDGCPAGYPTGSGCFAATHREEIARVARHLEQREKKKHPFWRIIDAEEQDEDRGITTTDTGLARWLGEAPHRACQGDADHQFTDGATPCA